MITTLTERGQVSVPAALRKRADLRPGQALRWEYVNAHEFRVVIAEAPEPAPSAVTMIGFAHHVNAGVPHTTAEVLRILRAGEADA